MDNRTRKNPAKYTLEVSERQQNIISKMKDMIGDDYDKIRLILNIGFERVVHNHDLFKEGP